MAGDIFDFLAHLNQERYRAVILHAAPDLSQATTQFVQEFCERAGGKYLDLLDFFIQNRDLSEQIDIFGPETFRALLVEESNGVKLLCVDRADFLLDTWRRAERQDFFRMVTSQWDGYKDGTQAKLIIVLQTSQEIETRRIVDSQGNSRILRLSDFNNIV